ncbi:BTB domain-containing protein [Favolaschia claudopus]|uniref:BTB domain-containing protein n=1 Tax=Favolaschia claudopus TaxID=2862362 RepID=A0AAW0DTH5_9AGAR
MSDLIRTASPLSSSPGRNSDSFERPTWPWQTRYSRRTSSSLSAASPSHLQATWDPSTSRPSSSQTNTFSTSGSWNTARQQSSSAMGFGGQEDGTRQWSFMGFEWVVRDVHKLRDFVEGVQLDTSSEDEDASVGPDDFEILKLAPLIGDDKFKLEIQPPVSSGTNSEGKPPTMTLCITSLILDFAHTYEMNASMMAAIKCQDERVGARPEWVWEYWQNDWVFRRESEVWDCALPSLTALLENPRIRETDSFTICVQVHCPVGPFFPQQPTAYYVPRDLLDGLEASLDNPNTGDVRFVCLERMPSDAETPATPLSEASQPTTRRPSSSTSSQSPFSPQTTARKRVIYAHSDILTRRSEYFATMLSSTFSETKMVPGDRKLYTVVVEEADFETVYWLLKYCYANWLSFKEQDDPRLAVEGIGGGWSARWLMQHRGGEWDWKTFTKVPGDDSTVASVRSATSAESSVADATATTAGKGKATAPDASSVSSPTRSSPQAPRPSSSKVVSNSVSTSRQASSSTSTSRRPVQPSVSGSSTLGLPSTGSGISRAKPVPLTTSTGYAASSHYPISPRTQRSHQAPVISTPDPHPHPTPPPPPASALAIYQVAHRYAMPALAALALDHIMSTITPATSFSVLLATSIWDELRTLVEDYVVDKWDEVSVSQEFEQCCQEVSAGEWGPEGGKTLMALFRRLRSPSAMGYARLKSRGLATSKIPTGSFIPLIDFSKFQTGSPTERKDTATEIVSAFKESGFIYLSNHGIPSATVQNAFAKSAQFFSLPFEVKDALKWEDPRSNRGYVKIGRERVTQATDAAEIAALREKAPDFKETMEIGRDWDSVWANQWPKETDAPEFKSTMLDFFRQCHELHVHVMRSIALGLDLDEGFFDDKIHEQSHNLRLLSYPPIKRSLLDYEGQARAGAHSDYGTLTLLFQDQVGGLEVQNPHTGSFVPALPIPGTIVVNVADLLARWSNDVLRSTLHRVVAPQARPMNAQGVITPGRQSIAFFCNPNFSAEIACLPNCGSVAKYPPISTEDYIVGRLTDTYT